MGNLFDYIEWRGDLSFEQSSFNEVDSLILCKLAYVDLTGIVPAPSENCGISISEAAKIYFAGRENEKIYMGVLVPNASPPLFKKLSVSKRFCDLELSAYVNQVDGNEGKQFSALTIAIGDGTKYVAFRGTDDTIVGWKENFNMSFKLFVPAQAVAAEYLRCIACSCSESLRVGGHSKGGNLAVYSAMHSMPEVQARIIEVYNNDGPGFGQSVIAQECYQNIHGRIKTIIPQSSIVGMLLEHEEEYEIVKSTGIGPFQHDGFTWAVSGVDFVHLDTVTGSCRYIDKTLKAWVDGVDNMQRRQFIEALFSIIDSTGAKTLTDLTTNKLKTANAIITAMRHLDKDTRDMLARTIRLLFKEGTQFSQLKNSPIIAIQRGEN